MSSRRLMDIKFCSFVLTRMEAIAQLQSHYLMIIFGIEEIQPCIDWAIRQLQLNLEGDDLDVVLLAAATRREEALPLVRAILDRYKALDGLDKQLISGKYVAGLRSLYLTGVETIESLDGKLNKLFCSLDYPNWLIMLSRNCEYSITMDVFREPFEQEFEYIAKLWGKANSFTEFQTMYRRETSNKHDAKYN